MKMVGFKHGDLSERLNFSASDTGKPGRKEIPSGPNRSRTYGLLISTSDAVGITPNFVRICVTS